MIEELEIKDRGGLDIKDKEELGIKDREELDIIGILKVTLQHWC